MFSAEEIHSRVRKIIFHIITKHERRETFDFLTLKNSLLERTSVWGDDDEESEEKCENEAVLESGQIWRNKKTAEIK